MKIITIIICSYNGEMRIGKVLDCIYTQPKLDEYVKEVIIVDNCSTDNTAQVIKECAEEYRIVPIRYTYEDKPGLSNARRNGVINCETEWIAFLDDDNFVQPNWIECVSDYIDNNSKVGAFNGAVVPVTNFVLDKEEKQRLKASLKVLACTHYNEDDIKKNPHSPFRNPIGAGMVIRTGPLKDLIDKGWLNSSGRTKDNLASGEDGEMAFWVKSQGYNFGFCPDAILFHEIPKSRLQNDYLSKMWYEIGKGVAIVARRQGINAIKRGLYEVLLISRWCFYHFDSECKVRYYEKYIEGFHEAMNSK